MKGTYRQMSNDIWNCYYANEEDTTIDGEWTDDELRSDIYDVCTEVMTDNELKRYENRALIDKDLLKKQYMTEHIIQEIGDTIEFYNKQYDKHRNENKFGIYLFDDAIKKLIKSELRRNLVVK